MSKLIDAMRAAAGKARNYWDDYVTLTRAEVTITRHEGGACGAAGGIIHLIPLPPAWQPADTAPYGKWVLAWWIPINDNPWAESVVVAQRCFVEHARSDEGNGAYEPGCWWANGRYYPGNHITAWMPLPAAPADRARPQ